MERQKPATSRLQSPALKCGFASGSGVRVGVRADGFQGSRPTESMYGAGSRMPGVIISASCIFILHPGSL